MAQGTLTALNTATELFNASFCFVHFCIATPVTIALAQLSPRQERLNAVDSFVVMFVQPKQICAIAGQNELASLNSVLDELRNEYLQAFEAVENSREYIATIATLHILDGEHLKALSREQARAECSKKTSQLQIFRKRANLKDRFKYLLDLFSTPI